MAIVPPTTQPSPLISYVFRGEFDVRGENPARQEILISAAPCNSTVVYICHIDRKVTILAHLDFYTNVSSTFNEIQKVLEKEQNGLRFSPGFKAIVIDREDSQQRQSIFSLLRLNKVITYGRKYTERQSRIQDDPDYPDPSKFIEFIYRPIRIQLSADTRNCGEVNFIRDNEVDSRFEYIQRRETEIWENSLVNNLSNGANSYQTRRASRTNQNLPQFDGSRTYSKLFEDELFHRLKIEYRIRRELSPIPVPRTSSDSLEAPVPPSSSYPPLPNPPL